MTLDKSGKLGLKLKVLMVEDAPTMRKIIRDYLKQTGLENTAFPDDDILPQAIFGLKNRGGSPKKGENNEYGH